MEVTKIRNTYLMDYVDNINEDDGCNSDQENCSIDVDVLKNLSGLKIVNYKIGGIGENFDEIEILLKENDVTRRLHILQVCESWLSQKSRKQNIGIDGFSYIRKDRANNMKKKGGGMVIYYNNVLDIEYEKYMQEWISSDDLEILYYRIKCKGSSDIFMVSVYRPPSSKHTVINTEKCTEILADILKKIPAGSNIVICGDWNVNFLNQEHNTKIFTDLCTGYSLKLLNHVLPTHFSKKSKSLIDVTYAAQSVVSKCGVLNHYGNKIYGHIPTFILLNTEYSRRDTNVVFTCRNMKQYVKENFAKELKQLNWNEFWCATDPELAWEIFSGNIIKTLDSLHPTKSYKKKRKDKTWLDGEALYIIKKRNNLFKKAKRTDRALDWCVAKEFQIEAKRKLRQIRASHLSEKFFDLKNNPSKFWKSANCIIRNTPDENVPQKLQGLGCLERQKTCEDFNEFFSEVGLKIIMDTPVLTVTEENELADRIKNCPSRSWDLEVNGENSIPKFELLEVEPATVYNIIKKLKLNKSSGLRGVPMVVFRDSCLSLLQEITHILNLSLCTGKFPVKWKEVGITPIYKGEGDILDPNNYRPISVVPTISKIIEKIFQKQLFSFLNENNLLCEEQHGFRPLLSIHTAISDFLEYTYNGLNDKEYIFSNFIDLRKAFDTVKHESLIQKLASKFNFGSGSLGWVTSFLSNRKQKCNFLGKSSDFLPVLAGVPQGSVLGPLFFSLFLNDCKDVLKGGKIVLYADDTAVLVKNKNLNLAYEMSQENLCYLNLWYRKNTLNLNAKKSKFSLYNQNCGIPRNLMPESLYVGKEKITRTEMYTYLGLCIDENLNFESHLDRVAHISSFRVGQLYRLRKIVNEKICTLILNAMIMPIFDTYSIYLMGCKKKSLKRLDTILNRAIRIVCRLPKRSNTDVKRQELGILEHSDRRIVQTLVYSYERSRDDKNLDNRPINTRSHGQGRKNLKRFTSNLSIIRKCYIYKAIEWWNKLDTNMHIIESKKAFKCHLKNNLSIVKEKCKIGVG